MTNHFNWASLTPLELYPWHSKRTAKLRDEINQQVADILGKRQPIDAELCRSCDVSIEDVDPEQLYSAHPVRASIYAVLRDELVARHRVQAEYRDAHGKDASKALDEAIKHHEAKQAEVRRFLSENGWTDTYVESDDPTKIMPIFIFSHRDVVAAKMRVNDLRSIHSVRPWPSNEHCIASIEEFLTSERDRILGVSVKTPSMRTS